MSIIEIRRIDATHAEDARIPNQSFQLWGRVVPSLENGKWSYTVEKNKSLSEDRFPDEAYDVEREDGIFLGAYEGDRCVGLALLRKNGINTCIWTI